MLKRKAGVENGTWHLSISFMCGWYDVGSRMSTANMQTMVTKAPVKKPNQKKTGSERIDSININQNREGAKNQKKM